MLLTMRHDARRAPMTFLYATLSRLRSSTESCLFFVGFVGWLGFGWDLSWGAAGF
jgi:hypothetical protein